jgi:hypothetical protein
MTSRIPTRLKRLLHLRPSLAERLRPYTHSDRKGALAR